MNKTFAIATVLIAVTFFPASATVINVPDDYTTIQAGIDACSDGDTVLVQPDTYVENISFNGLNIVLGSLFLTTGDTSYTSSTIIDGDSSSSVVTFENGEDSTAVITGFTLQNGYSFRGAGILCLNNSNPTISNNTIDGNFADDDGGGIHCSYSSPTIRYNTISRSSADAGGGIYCYRSHPVVSSNIIIENFATGEYGYGGGGGVHCDNNSNPTISANIIRENSANAGGGIYCRGSYPTISDNTISENIATGEYGNGGGIHCRENSSPTILNNTISGNIANNNDGGGIGCAYNSNPTISNNIVVGNSAYYSGGGIDCWNSVPTIHKNTISSNSANHGGGVRCYNSDPPITDNIISANSANYYGGGIHCWYSNLIIRNNIISANSSVYYGGGVCCRYYSPTISNNTISENLANYGGGIYCGNYSSPTVDNTIIAFSTQGEAVGCDGSSNATLACCDVYGNAGGDWVGCIVGQYGINGNICEDPLFCGEHNPEDPYTLYGNSPCVPDYNPDCGLIGARLVGCGPVICYCIGGCDSMYDCWDLLDYTGYPLEVGDYVYAAWTGPDGAIDPPAIAKGIGEVTGDDVMLVEGFIQDWGFRGFELTVWVWSPDTGHPTAGELMYCRIFDAPKDELTVDNYYGDSQLYQCQYVADEEFFCLFPGDPGYGHTDTPLAPVSVELMSFEAIGRDGEVLLEWKTASERSNFGFRIERSLDQVAFEGLTEEIILGAGNSETENTYAYVDKGLVNGNTYYYNLISVDMDGMEQIANESPVWTTPTAHVPEDFALNQNYPNPFNPETWISYQLPNFSPVTIKIYNVNGQVVNTLVDKHRAPGTYRVCWSGRDLHGTPVASGLYFCRLRAGDFDKTIKMVLVK